jgi:hypothetical protein
MYLLFVKRALIFCHAAFLMAGSNKGIGGVTSTLTLEVANISSAGYFFH